jgi:hypothetical protein
MALSDQMRKRSATIKASKGYPTGRFPMPDLKHARLALQMLPRAKGLSPAEEAEIRSRARAKLGKPKAKVKAAPAKMGGL